MALIFGTISEILKKPTIFDVICELLLFAAPIWIAVTIGLIAGWAWKPRWAKFIVDGKKGNFVDLNLIKLGSLEMENLEEREGLALTRKDLKHMINLVEENDDGNSWQPMMEKTMPLFSFKAWRREPKTGPPQYRSSTIFEYATPEIVRDFFWDDEFRLKNKWDDMLLQHNILEQCSATGTMVVRWVRKFPFFCSNREYIIGRRIWNADGTYYCVTKGVSCSSVPRQSKPRRVDLYYSSWCIRAVESRRGGGKKSACEVLLFHHEDMGIPWAIAKLGVRQGMWGCARKIEPGLRDYQLSRSEGDQSSKYYQLSRSEGDQSSKYALMAQINTVVDTNYLNKVDIIATRSSKEVVESEKQKSWNSNFSKFLMIGGALAVVCTIDRGLLTKAVIFGVARRFGRVGGRL